MFARYISTHLKERVFEAIFPVYRLLPFGRFMVELFPEFFQVVGKRSAFIKPVSGCLTIHLPFGSPLVPLFLQRGDGFCG